MNNISFIRYLKFRNIKDRVTYLKWYDFIEKSQWWTKNELDNYQWQKIKLLLEHSYNNVPYYIELFKKIGATPADIKNRNDFEKIPFLTKDIVRERSTDLIAKNVKQSSLHYYTTGGSTGEPLGFYKKSDISVIEQAFMFNQWGRVGYKENSSRVILRGEPVKDNKLWQKFRFSNVWLLSSYHLSEEYIKQYVDFLNKIRPEFLHVYPSSMYIFTQLLIESKLRLNFTPKAILCGSEPVRNFQRELFERTFNTRVYSWLGQAEGAVLAGECEHSTEYHLWPQHSNVELVDKTGSNISGAENSGEIIGTTINNFAYPFIRYRTGDLGEFGASECKLCKRQFQLLKKVDGRLQEVIVSKNGKYVPMVAINMHSDVFDNVVQFQFLQKEAGIIILNIIKKKTYSNSDNDKILNELWKKLGLGFNVVLNFVDEIPRTASGKHRFLDQKLEIPYNEY
jgi:phenylacetate-coenzyme A ligase PaaK-like adenylate-forming protein